MYKLCIALITILLVFIVYTIYTSNKSPFYSKKETKYPRRLLQPSSQFVEQSRGQKQQMSEPHSKLDQHSQNVPDDYFEQVTKNEREMHKDEKEGDNYVDFITSMNVDKQTVDNHEKWATEVGKWSMGPKKMKSAEFEVANTISFQGLRRPHAVERKHNPFQVQELGGEDVSENRKINW